MCFCVFLVFFFCSLLLGQLRHLVASWAQTWVSLKGRWVVRAQECSGQEGSDGSQPNWRNWGPEKQSKSPRVKKRRKPMWNSLERLDLGVRSWVLIQTSPNFYPPQDPSFDHSKTLMEHLLCAGHCARWWGCDDKQGWQVSIFPVKQETKTFAQDSTRTPPVTRNCRLSYQVLQQSLRYLTRVILPPTIGWPCNCYSGLKNEWEHISAKSNRCRALIPL